MPGHILVVDDEESIRQTLEGVLGDEKYQVTLAEDGRRALKAMAENVPDIVLLDIWMPGMDGIETLGRMKQEHPEVPVVIISGHGTIETAVKATKLGAYDFIEKPISMEKILLVIENALKLKQLEEENKDLRDKVAGRHKFIGDAPKILAPTNSSVLITGENGTGKEVIARMIHAESLRKDFPFVEVNCAAIPEELIESELFGYEKGAFTGALSRKKGKFDIAHKGTMFLDEIGDMSLKTQAKILRILQEQKFERVGGNASLEVDVRILAATNNSASQGSC
jgi:two-component system nitrogen regulation response regulator NtrX